MMLDTKPLNQITQEAIEILYREIGVVNTVRFLNQFTAGFGDYTAIHYAIWLCFTLPLSFRDVELLLAQRQIQVSHETIRSWCYRFGPIFSQKLRQKRRLPTDKWHLDEVFETINRRRYYLWRAVDSEGMVLDVLLQERRNARAAKQFFKKVLKTTPIRPRVIVTDGLRSYNIISRELIPKVEHRCSKYLNNRAENSHQPTRRREKRMQRFDSWADLAV